MICKRLLALGLVQHCIRSGEYSTRYLRQRRVAEASRRSRYAVASAPCADANIRHSIHRNLRKAVLAWRLPRSVGAKRKRMRSKNFK